MTSTVITALYDIGREKNGDGRTIEYYLKIFAKTLKLNVPIVVYTEQKFLNFVLENKTDNVNVIVKPLSEIPYYQYNDKIIKILNNSEYKSKIVDPNRIECNLSLYNVIQYSKFEWLTEAIQQNYFDTDYYFWMDAGCSRFFDDVNLKTKWPANYSLLDKTKFNIQGNRNTLYYPFSDIETYIWDSNCMLVGTLFGGSKEICKTMASIIKKEFEYYLDRGIVNNEQILLAVLYKKYPDLFNIYIELNNKHLPFFKKLA